MAMSYTSLWSEAKNRLVKWHSPESSHAYASGTHGEVSYILTVHRVSENAWNWTTTAVGLAPMSGSEPSAPEALDAAELAYARDVSGRKAVA